MGTQIARYLAWMLLFIALTYHEKSVRKKEAPHHYNAYPEGTSPFLPLSRVTAEAEKDHIIKILRSTEGNKTRAAEILGISRKTLWEKLKAHNIDL